MSDSRDERGSRSPVPAGGERSDPPSAPDWIVPSILAALVLASRYQAVRVDSELNVDESQLLAQVLRLSIDAVPWRGVDGTTGGPLNTWLLAVLAWLGVPLRYSVVHGLAALLLASLPVFTFAILRQVGGRASAAAGATAAALTLALAQSANFAHLTSELLPAVVVCGALLCLTSGSASEGSRRPLVAASVLTGLLPWTKLQSSPAAVSLALWILAVAIRPGRDDPWRGPGSNGRRLAVLVGALALPSVVMLGIVSLAGAWRDFWMSYLVANAGYTGASSPASIAWKLRRMLPEPPSRLLAGTAAFAALWWALGRPGWATASGRLRECVPGLLLLITLTLVSILLPREPFAHYQIVLVAPASIAAGCLLSLGSRPGRSPWPARAAGALFAVLVPGAVLTTSPAAVRSFEATRAFRAVRQPDASRRIAGLVRKLAPGAGRMLVWGWMPGVYVASGLPPCTRHAVGHYVIDAGSARSYLRASLLADVLRERPDVVVDAVAAGCFVWKWDASQRLESFPELAAYVRSRYVLAAEERLAGEGEPVRIYVSREYLRRHASGARPGERQGPGPRSRRDEPVAAAAVPRSAASQLRIGHPMGHYARPLQARGCAPGVRAPGDHGGPQRSKTSTGPRMAGPGFHFGGNRAWRSSFA